MKAPLDAQSVIKANAQFWEQMLAMKLEALGATENCTLGPGNMAGSVALDGIWKGKVEIRLDEGLAYEATSAMMMQSADSLAETDALDAVREIANMIAGTIKSSLPRPCSMAVPESSVEAAGYCAPAAMDDSLVVSFRHSTGELVVRIWEEEFASG